MTYDFMNWSDENYGDDRHETGLTLSVTAYDDAVALVLKSETVPGLIMQAEFTFESTDLDAFINKMVELRNSLSSDATPLWLEARPAKKS